MKQIIKIENKKYVIPYLNVEQTQDGDYSIDVCFSNAGVYFDIKLDDSENILDWLNDWFNQKYTKRYARTIADKRAYKKIIRIINETRAAN